MTMMPMRCMPLFESRFVSKEFYKTYCSHSFQFINKLNVTMQNGITREFIRRLLARYASNTDVPDEYGDRTLSLYVLSLQTRLGIRPWSDVDLVTENLPPSMASDAIIRRDGENKLSSLHIAAGYAPRIVIDRRLKLVPDAVRVTTLAGFLPIHYAAYRNNVDAIELLTNVYTESVIGKTKYGKTPLYYTAGNARNNRHPKVSRSDIVKLLVRSYSVALFTTLFLQKVLRLLPSMTVECRAKYIGISLCLE